VEKNRLIGIIGGYGFNNWGDDAQLYNNIRLLKQQGYKNLVVMSPNNYIKTLCDCKTIPSFHNIFKEEDRHNEKKLIDKAVLIYYITLDYDNRKHLLSKDDKTIIDKMRKFRILFVSGSGTINTRGLYGLLVILLTCLVAKNFKKAVIMSGQGFLPLNHKLLEPFISLVLNQCDKIFTRDFELGKMALKRINVDLNKIVLGVDDAFTIPRTSQQIYNLPNKAIAINISQYIDNKFTSIIYSFACNLKEKGYSPIFTYFQGEIDLIKKCSHNKFPSYGFKKPEDLALFYSKVYASIGMRYHSTIFGLAGGNPTVNIYITEYQKNKLEAIQKETNIPNFMICLSNITSNNLTDILMKAIQTQSPYLQKINKSWKQKANLAIKYLETLK